MRASVFINQFMKISMVFFNQNIQTRKCRFLRLTHFCLVYTLVKYPCENKPTLHFSYLMSIDTLVKSKNSSSSQNFFSKWNAYEQNPSYEAATKIACHAFKPNSQTNFKEGHKYMKNKRYVWSFSEVHRMPGTKLITVLSSPDSSTGH